MAQTRPVAGKVTDKADGSPLPGVTISIKGTSKGTITNTQGEYRIEAGNGDVLVFSFIGYATQELPVPGGGVLNVSMGPDDKTLSEVVVTGYVDINRRDATASTSKIDATQINNRPIQSFDQALDGLAAGVNVNVQSGVLGDRVAIRIRGVNSISNSGEPLIVVDGVVLNNTRNTNIFNSGNGTRYNPMADINPNDIESVDVLKDASAAALYGSRAANGVIVITTKKGKRGAITVNYNTLLSWSSVRRAPKLLTGDEFAGIQNEKSGNMNQPDIAADFDENGDGKPERTDWLDVIFRTGFQQSHQLSFSGGTEKSQVYGSAEYADMNGFLVGNRLRRGSARINADVTPKSWLKMGMGVYGSRVLNNGVLSDGYLAGATIAGYNAPPNVPVYNSTGDYEGYYLSPTNRDLGNGGNRISERLNRFFHPLASVYLGRNDNETRRILANVYGELTPVSGLKLTSRFSVDYLQNFEDQYGGPNQAGNGFNLNGLVQENLYQTQLWNWTNMATYTRTFAEKHNLSVLGALEYQYDRNFQLYTGQANIADDYFKYIYDGLSAGEGNSYTGGAQSAKAFDSYLGRVAYNYASKYYVEAIFRSDAYSDFGVDNRRGFFPGGSIGWRLSEESFIKDNASWVNELKLRASYGIVGNNLIPAYASRTMYGGGQYADDNGLNTAQLGDPNLRWERAKKLDIGIDAGFFNNRLGLTMDFFNNDVDDLVLDAPVLRTTGIPNAYVTTNIGEMWNRGFEITVRGTPVINKELEWNVSANATFLKNKVTKLVDGSDIPSGSNRASVGRPLGVWYMIDWVGVNPETGYGMFRSKDGEVKMYNPSPGVATANRWTTQDGSRPVTSVTANDANYLEGKTGYPTWYGGLENTLSYKGFTLNIAIQYSGGNYILNSTRQGLMTNFLNNNLAEIKDRWTPENKNTDVPKIFLRDAVTVQTSTRWLEKGDYLRLKTVSLGYAFPEIRKKLGMSNLRLFIAGDNLAMLTGYKGADPEINTNRTANIAFGVDNRGVPIGRTISLGLNASF